MIILERCYWCRHPLDGHDDDGKCQSPGCTCVRRGWRPTTQSLDPIAVAA